VKEVNDGAARVGPRIHRLLLAYMLKQSRVFRTEANEMFGTRFTSGKNQIVFTVGIYFSYTQNNIISAFF
jgi:hypothetical protein